MPSMSGFSPDWLAMREAADHRARCVATEQRLTARFAGRGSIAVTDIGCGTGSNLRATFALLPPEQSWTLVDYDAHLLGEARAQLIRWANLVTADGDTLLLRKAGRRLTVRFRQADLSRDLDEALGTSPDLVTASAFFDLASAGFIDAFARAVAARRSAFYTVLTYNGIQTWAPAHEADAAMTAAFHAHQATDKGFGAAAGPAAPATLRKAFTAAGYEVSEGDSPWTLGIGDRKLVDALASGYAAAVAETRLVSASALASWSAVERTGCVVGHTDTLALPR
jgi:SAM-dependent methyltransferase